MVGLAASFTGAVSTDGRTRVLIRTPRPYDAIVTAIVRAGGSVTARFKHVDGLAAEVPDAALAQIQALVGGDNLSRDELIPLPQVADPRSGRIEAVVEAEASFPAEASGDLQLPANYTFNAGFTNVDSLHAEGFDGDGVIIAVIDSGYRPVMRHVHPTRLILPGLNLVPGATEPPAIADANGSHGTFVAGMAAANIAFCFGATNRFVVLAEHYGAAFPSSLCASTARLVPMVGSAPAARIFPIKIFPAAGGGAPSSRVIAAMEAAIDLRQRFDAGDPTGLNIQVVNMSLGGPTFTAARSLADQAVEALINADIVPVVAAGNEGFSSVTTGSPSTSFAALTVGSANSSPHERVFRAQFSLPCATIAVALVVQCATSWRPDDTMQMSEFSSRGPTHDGRPDPDVVAIGSHNFSQGSGTATTVNFGSGTSFATPTISGIAAVLRQAHPGATAKQIRNAIISSANDDTIPTADRNDHGKGFVDAAAAHARLTAGGVPNSYSKSFYTRYLAINMLLAGRWVYHHDVSLRFNGVRPAEVTDIPFNVPANTLRMHARIHSIEAELPPAAQNPFFTDDVFMRIQSSAVHRDDLRAQEFILAGEERLFTFERPEAGVWRITPTGDWTNAGRVSYTVDLWIETERLPQHTAKGLLTDGEVEDIQFTVPSGTTRLDTRLAWLNMNGNYPIADVDVVLTPPVGPAVFTCATVRTPELCAVENPVSGVWTASVIGFSVPLFGIPGNREHYALTVAADGRVLKEKGKKK
jgi:subtilisin family serine protease